MDRVTRTIWLGRDKRELTDQSRGAFEEKKIKNDGHVGQSSLRLRRRRLTRLVHRSMNRAAVSLLLMVGVGVGVGVGVEWPAASASRLGRYQTAAVSSEDGGCSRIGRRALADGGSAVDAAVAVLFCIGVVHSQAAGIGGGSVFTVYEAAAGRARVLDARETAPQAATEDMFGGNITAALIGGLAVAVPGELAGSWEAHRRYGRLPWRRLVEPAIRLAEDGVAVNEETARTARSIAHRLRTEPSMRHFFDADTGEPLRRGQVLRQPALARTLRLIASHGAGVFYNGTLAASLVADVAARGGVLSRGDLAGYRPRWSDAVRVDLSRNVTLWTTPPPASGSLVALILNVLDRLPMDAAGAAAEDPLTYHRMAEAMKHAYGWRTRLGDPTPAPDRSAELVRRMTSDRLADEIAAKIDDRTTSDDAAFYGADGEPPAGDHHGTSHVSVLDADGLAVSVTSTINNYFGAGFASSGVVLNSHMADFAIPNAVHYFGVASGAANRIAPGKRPLTSMSGSVLTDTATNRTRLVVGAAGGTRIVTAVVGTIVRHLWFGESLKEAIDRPRVHHQLHPMKFQYELGFPAAILEALEAKGHRTGVSDYPTVVTAVAVDDDGVLYANSDGRGTGDVAGLDENEADSL